MIWLALTLAIVFFILSVIFTIYPILPGPVIAFVGVIVYAAMAGFHTLPPWVYVLSASMVVLSFLVDTLCATLGVKRAGGSKYAMVGAAVGTLIFPFLLGPLLGILLGTVVGAMVGEAWMVQRAGHLAKVGLASLFGFLFGMLFKLIAVSVIIIAFFIGRM